MTVEHVQDVVDVLAATPRRAVTVDDQGLS